MAVIHSDKLASQGLTGAGATDVLYTVPADTVVILRDWAFFNGAAAPRVVSLDLLSGTVRVALVSNAAIAAVAVLRPAREEWLVLEPGDQIRAAADSANVRIWLAGTRLSPV